MDRENAGRVVQIEACWCVLTPNFWKLLDRHHSARTCLISLKLSNFREFETSTKFSVYKIGSATSTLRARSNLGKLWKFSGKILKAPFSPPPFWRGLESKILWTEHFVDVSISPIIAGRRGWRKNSEKRRKAYENVYQLRCLESSDSNHGSLAI